MFNYLSGVGTELHAQFVQMYWVLLVPFVALLCVLEILKDESPNLKEIFRRLVISILLLYSFDWVVGSIATVGDAITSQVNGLEKLSDVLGKLGPNYAGHDSLFSLRETAIYILSLGSYLVAYLGFFVATALTHFVWTILYVCAPLMILMFVSRHTSSITMSLYKGLIQVVIWKILWSILGVLLLKLAIQPQNSGLDDYLMSMIVNLCIGISMLFIPMATKSLISDGMSSFASTLSLAPAIAAAGAIKIAATKWAGQGATAMKNAGVFAAKPLTNPVAGRMQLMKERLKPRFESFKKSYGSIGLPQELKNRRKRDF